MDLLPYDLTAIKSKRFNTIIWMANDICPFECWYCPERTWGGNTKTPYTWGQCSDFLDILYERIPSCSFVITGGEPTGWPLLPNLLDKVYKPDFDIKADFGWFIFIISNMSKSKGFIDEWIDKTHYLVASYHPNVINTSKKREAWFEKVLSFKHRTRISIRMLMDPLHWDHCLEMFHSLNDENILLEPVTVLSFTEGWYWEDTPHNGNSNVFAKQYTQEQIEILNDLTNKTGSFYIKSHKFDHTISNEIILEYKSGDRQVLKDQSGNSNVYQQIVSKGLNQFKGWHCEIGFKDLFIGPAGEIAPSVCMAHRPHFIGNINNFDKIKWPTKATICPHEWCLCGSDLMIPKYKVTEEYAA